MLVAFSYPACNVHKPYYHLWPAWFYQIFPQIAWFSEKKLWNMKCVFWFSLQLLSETFLILRRTRRDTVTDYTGLQVKYPLFSSDLKESWIFSTDFRNKFKYQISWKSVLWEPSCFMRMDGRTDMTKLTVAFRNFAKTPIHDFNGSSKHPGRFRGPEPRI